MFSCSAILYFMNHEAGFAASRPSREQHIEHELHDLEGQFAELEARLASGETGRSGHKLRLAFAYDKLVLMEEKGELTDEQIAAFHARAERINGQLYEEAA